MAGLNDDIEEGLPALEGDTVDILESQSSIIDEPTSNPKQPTPDKITLVTQDTIEEADKKNVVISDLFGTGVIPGELPNFDAEFVIVTQRDNNLQDFSTITNSIRNKQTVSQEDARVIDSLSPGFLNDNTRSISYFTKEQTKVQFVPTIKELDSRIEKEINEINIIFKQHVEKLSQAYLEFNNLFNADYKEQLIIQHETITKYLQTNWGVLNNLSKDFYFTAKFKLHNFLTTPMDEFEIRDVTSDRFIYIPFDRLLESLKNISLREYLISFRFASDGNLLSSIKASFSEECITINELAKIYLSDSQVKLSNEISLKLENNQSKLKEIISKFELNKDNTNFISNVEDEIKSIQNDLKILSNLITGLNSFNKSFNELLIAIIDKVN